MSYGFRLFRVVGMRPALWMPRMWRVTEYRYRKTGSQNFKPPAGGSMHLI